MKVLNSGFPDVRRQVNPVVWLGKFDTNPQLLGGVGCVARVRERHGRSIWYVQVVSAHKLRAEKADLFAVEVDVNRGVAFVDSGCDVTFAYGHPEICSSPVPAKNLLMPITAADVLPAVVFYFCSHWPSIDWNGAMRFAILGSKSVMKSFGIKTGFTLFKRHAIRLYRLNRDRHISENEIALQRLKRIGECAMLFGFRYAQSEQDVLKPMVHYPWEFFFVEFQGIKNFGWFEAGNSKSFSLTVQHSDIEIDVMPKNGQHRDFIKQWWKDILYPWCTGEHIVCDVCKVSDEGGQGNARINELRKNGRYLVVPDHDDADVSDSVRFGQTSRFRIHNHQIRVACGFDELRGQHALTGFCKNNSRGSWNCDISEFVILVSVLLLRSLRVIAVGFAVFVSPMPAKPSNSTECRSDNQHVNKTSENSSREEYRRNPASYRNDSKNNSRNRVVFRIIGSHMFWHGLDYIAERSCNGASQL